MLPRTILAGAVAACLAAGAVSPARADPFPDHPVRVIVPFPPYSAVDVVMRLFQQRFSELAAQSVVIDNRPGASGNIGTELAAHAAPDGHTLLATTLPLVVNQGVFGKVPYDAARDFRPVSLLAAAPFVLAVYPSLPVSTVREFVAYVRVRPGELNYGSTGAGTNPHVAAELFKSLARLDIMHVPYKARGPALAALIGGETQIGFFGVVPMAQLARSGRLRAVGVTSARRSPLLPEIPTLAEGGVAGYEFTGWYGVLAPRGTPDVRVVALNGHIRNALRSPGMAERFAREGAGIIASTPEEFEAHLRAEIDKWARVAKAGGLSDGRSAAR